MRSIERRFNYLKQRKENRNLSSFVIFAKSVQGKGFSEDRLRRAFNKLVDKSDYANDEKTGLYKYLYQLTKDPL